MKQTTYLNIFKGLSIFGAFLLGFFFCMLLLNGIDGLTSIGLIVSSLLVSICLIDNTDHCIPEDEIEDDEDDE